MPRLAEERIGEGFSVASENTGQTFVLQVQFLPNTTLDDIATILLPFSGTISDGPSAIGLVRLAFVTEDDRAQGLEALRMRSDLVSFIAED
ncbi:hypothetical protein [Yoonia sp. SS1-5]|uniref:Uncharacterized protein n=1 Tax=Yoonia rhodophyticola TaxID=3137370 RepID=A0AAN0M8Z8_9RHOB